MVSNADVIQVPNGNTQEVAFWEVTLHALMTVYGFHLDTATRKTCLLGVQSPVRRPSSCWCACGRCREVFAALQATAFHRWRA
jgi:hypothetical protein